MTDRPSYAFLIVAAAAAVTIFAYAGALSGPFVFDDEHNILRNPHIRIEALSPHALYAAAFQSPLPTRPVANVSFALNFFFNGYNVVGYRLINVAGAHPERVRGLRAWPRSPWGLRAACGTRAVRR